jgi:hypothetical protein
MATESAAPTTSHSQLGEADQSEPTNQQATNLNQNGE